MPLPSMFSLRPLTMSDASILLAWRNDSEVIKWSRQAGPQSDLDAHLKWLRSRLAGRSGERFRIIETEIDRIPVGLVWTTVDSDNQCDVPEVHYRVDTAWRNLGIASRIVPMFVRNIVAPLQNGMFKCPIIKGNTPSERVAVKLGLHPGPSGPISRNDQRIIVDWIL